MRFQGEHYESGEHAQRNKIQHGLASKKAKSMKNSAIATACCLLLAVTACNKTTAPASNTVKQSSAAFSVEDLKQQRLAWNLTTLVESYEHAGYTNPKWDASAKTALTEFARSRANVVATNEPFARIISTNAAAAVNSGCNDPMVNYLFIRYTLDQTNSKETFTAAFCKMEEEMQKSSYPNIRKFYAAFRTADQFIRANNYPTNLPPEIRAPAITLTSTLWPRWRIKQYLPKRYSKLAMKPLRFGRHPGGVSMEYHNIEAPLLRNWPDAATSWLLKGQANLDMAWQARGGGYANTVTAGGWIGFKEHLAVANESLGHAWKLDAEDPRIAVKMMWVELGQGNGRDQMELWFQRAMELDPNDYDACSAKCLYLEPKWYGSIEEMLTFCRSCVTNKHWGGRVPLILVNAHWDIPRVLSCRCGAN